LLFARLVCTMSLGRMRGIAAHLTLPKEDAP